MKEIEKDLDRLLQHSQGVKKEARELIKRAIEGALAEVILVFAKTDMETIVEKFLSKITHDVLRKKNLSKTALIFPKELSKIVALAVSNICESEGEILK